MQLNASDFDGPNLMTQSPISVLIADDDEFVREALAAIVAGDPTLVLTGVAADAGAAIELAAGWPPDVALIDVMMPGGGGARAAREIAARSGKTKIVALSARDDRASVLEMLKAGAIGYVTKESSDEQILDTLRRCAAGESVFEPAVARDVMRDLLSTGEAEAADPERSGRLQRIVDIGLDDTLSMAFQPIVDIDSGEVVSIEALARFKTPEKRNTEWWFQEANDLGVLIGLETMIVRKVLKEMRSASMDGMAVNINISPTTLISDEFKRSITNFPRDRIVLEITEHAPVRDYDQLNEAIAELRESGMKLAIDDAGAGFASLRHILNLMPDVIKLDLSLTQAIDLDPARRALASGLISFATEIGADIVAEGIETQAELETLRELGVGFGQGYFIARPAPLPGEFGRLLSV